jgi:Ca2+/H+ antiporter
VVKSAAVSSYEEREHGQSWRNAFGRPVAFRSLGLAILLIAVHALGMLFSLRPHRELFASVSHAAEEENPRRLL